MKYTKSLKC